MPEIITRAQAAELAGVSERRMFQIDKEGDPPPRDANGKYAAREYGAWLKRRALSGMVSVNGEVLDLDAERARLAKEQADRTAMENAERRQHLVDVNLVADWWVKIITTAKQRLLGLPTKIAPLVIGCKTIPQAKDVIENNIHEILHELSATDPIAGASGAERLAPATETDGERVGGPEPKAKPRKQRRARSVAN